MQRDLGLLNPYVASLAVKLIEECKNQGITIIVTGTLRTYEEQDALYAQGRTAPGKRVTNAPGGYSLHNFGYAFDIAVVKDGKAIYDDVDAYNRVGEIGKSLGLEWGGDFKSIIDRPHFQITQGLTTAQFREGLRPTTPDTAAPAPVVEPVLVVPPAPKVLYPTYNKALIKRVQAIVNEMGIRDDDGHALAEDGIPGDKTKQALKRAIVKRGDKNKLVGIIQEALKIKVDNNYGNAPFHQTYDAIIAFQKKHKLGVDGKVGLQTWSELLWA
jgi:peptidoglycan L-alanyl-D-glutamate endopeptidase CwlK